MSKNEKQLPAGPGMISVIDRVMPYKTNSGVICMTIHIGPELAMWLRDTCNVRNRPFSATVANRYARDMREGRYPLNGEPIIIDTDGRLLDGQHTLGAVIRSGAIITKVIVIGISPDAFDTINQGYARSGSHVLAIDGFTNYARLAAGLRMAAWYSMDSTFATRAPKMPGHHVLSAINEYPEMVACNATVARFLPRNGTRGITTPKNVLFLWWLLSRIDEDDAVAFLDKVILGKGMEADDPEYILRTTIERLDRDPRHAWSTAHFFALVFKAWNARRDGRIIKNLRWSRNGQTGDSGQSSNETVPEPR